jgi:predicted dehydrogenase
VTAPLRVGIISANWGAFAHLPAWRAVPGVEVVGICTSRRETAEAAAARHAIPRAFWNAEQMAADPGIDIVDCGTRPAVRQSMVLAALRSGKHVYNAIPFAADLERARALRDAWRASGTVGVVDAYSQWLPAHRQLREMLDADFLGQPFGGMCHMNMPLYNRPDPRFPYNWFSEAGHGVSALRNLGSHLLHLLVHLFGAIDELVAHEGILLPEWEFPDGRKLPASNTDYACLTLRFASGMAMQMQVSWCATLGAGWMIDAFGSKGRALLQAPSFPTNRETTLHAGAMGDDRMKDRLQRVDIAERYWRTPEVLLDGDAPVAPSYPMAISMQRMVAAIRDQRGVHGQHGHPAPDFEQAWMVERVLEAAHRSAAEQRWVRLSEIS